MHKFKLTVSLLASFVLQSGSSNCGAGAGEIKSDGLNVIHDSSAVLLRPQMRMVDGQMKLDAVLNAQEVLARYPKITVIHVIYGTTQHQHLYKRVDVDAGQIANIARASDSLQVVDWDALKDEQLPGYAETANGKGIFADDAEHCRQGSMWINGGFTSDGGTVQLARTDEDLKQLKARPVSSVSSPQSRSLPTARTSPANSRNSDPFDRLKQQRSNYSPSTARSGRSSATHQSSRADAWQRLTHDYSPR